MWIAVGERIPPRNRAMLFWGLYESAEYRFVRDHLSPHLPVLECGAGIGAISSCIARLLAPGQKLVCVEGNPQLLASLRRNLRRYGEHLSTHIVERVIGHNEDAIAFMLTDDNLCSHRTDNVHGDRVAYVPSTSVSDILGLQDWSSGWQLVSDIEGGEVVFLQRDSECLSHCVRIIIELHDTTFEGRTVCVDELHSEIVRRGFGMRARHGNVFVFERRSEDVAAIREKSLDSPSSERLHGPTV